MQENQTLTLYPNKTKLFVLLLISIIFVIVGIFMIRSGNANGWYTTIFFGIGALVFIVNAFPQAAYLKLSKEGFEVCSLFRKSFTSWRDVKDFQAGKVSVNTMVVFDFTEEHLEYQGMKKVAETLTGHQGSLPDTYGKPANELAQIMTDWKQKSLSI
ncbi:hypothetical protein KKG46_01500 [Patescibacteria group bacterium]|nr:hypothetical protein [Patescibacteria group bacterium]